MRRIYLSWLFVGFFSLTTSMHRNLSQEDMSAIQQALADYAIIYQETMPTVKKPLVPHAVVNHNKTLFLIDLNRKEVVSQHVIAQRPATC